MRRILAVLGSAGLYGLAFPPFEQAWLSWVALAPLALALRGASWWRAARLGALWGFAATLWVIAWIVPTVTEHFGKSLPFAVLFWLTIGALAAAPYLAVALGGWAAAMGRLPAGLGAPLFAAAWVAAEHVRLHVGLESPWASLGHAQAGVPAVRQLAAVTGVAGISGLLAWGGAVAADLLAALAPRRTTSPVTTMPSRLRASAGALVFAVVLGVVLVAGQRRAASLSLAPADGLDLALVQGNEPLEARWRRGAAGRVLVRYGLLTRALLHERPEAPPALIVWPENAIQTEIDDPVFGPPLFALTQRGVPILLGAPRSELREGRRHQFVSAHLLRPDGRREHYDKRHLVPFSESHPFGALARLETPGDGATAEAYTPGDHVGLFDVAGERIGMLICVEAVYPALAREAVRAGATLVLNLTNDGWIRREGGARQHAQQALFRAIETGVPFVRATPNGVTEVFSPDGRTVASIARDQSAYLRLRLPPAVDGGTAYARTGELFARLCLGVWLVASLVGSRPPAARLIPAARDPGRTASSPADARPAA